MLAKPTIASTVPAAAVRSPRRANGLNSGSTCEASLVSRPSCSVRFGVRSDSGCVLIFCSSTTMCCISSACSGRVSRNSTRPSSGAGVRRLQAVAAPRGRRRTTSPTTARATRRSGWHHSSSCCATHSRCLRGDVAGVHRAAARARAGTRARSSSCCRPCRARAAARSTWREQASENSVCSSAHFAGIHCS